MLGGNYHRCWGERCCGKETEGMCRLPVDPIMYNLNRVLFIQLVGFHWVTFHFSIHVTSIHPFCPQTHPSSTYPLIHLSFYPHIHSYIHPSTHELSIHPLIHLSTYSSLCSSIHLPIYPPIHHLSIRPSIHPSTHLSIYMSIHLSFHLSTHPGIHLHSPLLFSLTVHLTLTYYPRLPREFALSQCAHCQRLMVKIISVSEIFHRQSTLKPDFWVPAQALLLPGKRPWGSFMNPP